MTQLTKKLAKKLFITLGTVTLLLAIQFTTYYTIANDRLTKAAINNLIVNDNFGADSILFSSTLSIRGNQQELIPYKLTFSSKENIKLLKKKLQPYTFLTEQEYETYCDAIAQAASKQMKEPELSALVENLYKNKSRLYITALEDQKFLVTVNTNWSNSKQIQYEEDQYIWILFFWMNI